MDYARQCAEQSGGTIEIVHNIDEAVKDASVIYGRGWKAIGKTIDEDLNMRKPFKDWRITQEHLNVATPDAIFMNSMPVSRETDATSEVIDGPHSVIYDEAENRLHAQKAILALLMG
jgi:ornithine carbamoyltransferase